MKTEKSHRGKKKSQSTNLNYFFFHNNIILLPLYLSMSEYQPTSIVLAKVKGYPAWPAMVLDESLLPEHISNKKPKSKTNPPTSISSPTPQSPSKRNLQ